MADKETNSGRFPDSKMSEEEMQRTAAVFHAIASAIGEKEAETREEALIAFEWHLGELLRLIPREYWVSDPLPPEVSTLKATVIVEDLFGQLSRGRVTATVAQLLFGVSRAHVAAEAFSDQTTVSLPLPMIVTALDPLLFRERTTKEDRPYKTGQLPDLFCQPSPRPLVREPAVTPAPPLEPAPEPPTGIEIPQTVRLPGVRAFGAPPEALRRELAAGPADAGAPPATPPPPHAAALTLGAPSTPVPTAPPRTKEDTISRAMSDLEMIRSAASPEEESLSASEESLSASFEMSLYDLLDLIPRKHLVTMRPPPETRDQKVTIVVDDLLKQLATGRVALKLSQLLYAVPLQFLQPSALEDQAPIALPLHAIVSAIDPATLRRHTVQTSRSYRMQGLPDFFLQPELSGAWPAAPAPPPPEKAPEPPQVPAAAVPPAEPAVPALEPEAEMGRLGGINLNTATVEQLMTLDRVTRALAESLVQFRAEHGPLKDVFDLFNVPRIGRKTFRAITGMPYSPRRRHRCRKLAALLDLPPGRMAHLPTVARTLATKPGFAGCVISDREGFLMAQHGVERLAELVSAVVPRLMRDVTASMTELGASKFDSASIHVEGSMFTVVPAGDVFLTAFHQATRLTSGQFRLIQRVAVELQWLVSRRGYVAG